MKMDNINLGDKMTSYINFELSENKYQYLIHALEFKVEMCSNYAEIRWYTGILDTLQDQYDKNSAEYTENLHEEIKEQNFRQYLIDNDVIDKEILKQHYMEFLKQNENE